MEVFKMKVAKWDRGVREEKQLEIEVYDVKGDES
jgi:hypothetical protein